MRRIHFVQHGSHRTIFLQLQSTLYVVCNRQKMSIERAGTARVRLSAGEYATMVQLKTPRSGVTTAVT